MPVKKFSGVLDDQRVFAEDLAINAAPVRRRIINWFRVPTNVVMSLAMMAGASWYYSDYGAWVLATALLLSLWGMVQKEYTPLKMPIQGKTADPNQPNPANGLPSPGAGIFYLGNDIRTNKEVWLTNDDCRQHFLVLGTTGAGKSLAKDAAVHTPQGWRLMGDLAVGDLVSTPDGKTAPVEAVFPQGELDQCRVTFSDGRSAEACPGHLWEIRYPDGSGLLPVLMTTQQVAAAIASDPGLLHVRLPAPLEMPQSEDGLPHFYRQGLALGGNMPGILPQPGRKPVLQSRDLPQPAASCGPLVPVPGRVHGSVAQRWALVRGLMDASGWSNASGSAMAFDTPDYSLAVFVQDTVRSLGGLATAVQAGSSGCHRVAIEHWDRSRFFSSERAKSENSARAVPATTQMVAIKGVEMGVRRADSVCIRIGHPDHLFVTKDYVVTHNTESLLGFAANALSWGSGFLFCDGKGDVSLFAKVFAMARRFGREDDLLVLNFMTGNRDGSGSGADILSNTLNPFSNGSSDGLTQMVVSLMDDVGGDGAMWKGRATAMLTGIMRALCWLRDQGILALNVSEIRDHMQLKKIIELADEAKHPDLPAPIRKSIRSYLTSLPGFQEEKKEKQAQTTLDQHGYLEMQFTKILGSLADVYGHIFATPYGEVDMYDVVLSRRLLVIMLPALEKAPDEIANLGKIVVATLKGMMGATLGSKLEGSWDDVVENRPTNSPSPFLCILDEVGYYTVEGMALMAAQARSLGFSMIFASQDINAMKKINEKEAAPIVANTNTKIFMKTEDPNETADLAKKRGDKALRATQKNLDRQSGDLVGRHHIDGDSASYEEADVVSLSDLTGQQSGEMHVMNGSTVVRVKGFYADPASTLQKNQLQLRANHFIKVPKPRIHEILAGIQGPTILEKLARPETVSELKADSDAAVLAIADAASGMDEIAMASMAFDRLLGTGRKPIEASCAAVAEMVKAMTAHVGAFRDDVHSSYAAPVPPPEASYMLDDFDGGEEGGFSDSYPDEVAPVAGRRPGVPADFDAFEGDPFAAMASGVPLAPRTDPPIPPPRSGTLLRPAAQAAARGSRYPARRHGGRRRHHRHGGPHRVQRRDHAFLGGPQLRRRPGDIEPGRGPAGGSHRRRPDGRVRRGGDGGLPGRPCRRVRPCHCSGQTRTCSRQGRGRRGRRRRVRLGVPRRASGRQGRRISVPPRLPSARQAGVRTATWPR